jgi:hypothetical protein
MQKFREERVLMTDPTRRAASGTYIHGGSAPPLPSEWKVTGPAAGPLLGTARFPRAREANSQIRERSPDIQSR